MRFPRRLVPAALALATLPLGVAVTPPAQASSPLHTIPFSSASVDPARSWEEGDPGAGNLVLVQFERIGAPGVVQQVAGTGAVLVQPLAPVSYLVWADRAQAAALRDLPGVRWAGVLPPEVRVAGSVTARTTQLRVTLVDAGAVADLGGGDVWSRAFTSVEGAVTIVAGDARRAAQLSRLPAVYSVADAGGAPELRDEKGAQVVAGAVPLVPGYRDFLQRIGADGTGVIVSHVDGGVDMRHPELAGRIAACTDYSTPGGAACTAGNTDDVVGHGTHTLGVLLGTGSTGLGDGDGFDYGLGVAPGATAVVQNAIHATARAVGRPFARGYRPLYREAWSQGAIVSQNSWGPDGSPKGYDEKTREFDSMVRDVDETSPGDQQLGLVFSIMNGRGGTSTQGTPDEAKNIIAVGGTGARKATATTTASPTVDDLCTCTAHGPALDGRLLPTLVAPAQNVMSTRAPQATLCGAIGAAGDVPPSPLHSSCTGTSFASPHVTGGYAVFVQWYRQRHGATPSPALVKAAFVNGADDLAGRRDANGRTMTAIPNAQQGWGRFNLRNVVDAWSSGEVHVDQSVVLDASGQAWTAQVEPVDPTRPMKVSLVWTDALGPGLGGKVPGWVNDLDLSVTTAGGATYLGNVFEDGSSVAGGAPDRLNNIENVYLLEPRGVHTVRVAAANLLGDGLPNREGLTDQDFALVVTNARRVGTAQGASRAGG